MVIACAVAVLGAVAVTGHQASIRADLPFTVIAADGRRPLPTSLVGDRTMVALDDLASLFQLTVREDSVAGGMIVSSRNRSAILTPGQALVSANGRLVSLPAPVVRDGRRWLVPVEFINRALALVCDTRLDVRKNSRLVLVGDVRVPRVVIREDASGAQARVTFEVSPRTPHTIAQEPARLLVKFDADALDVALPTAPPQGLVQGIRVVDPAGTIAIDLGPRVGTVRTSVIPGDQNSLQIVLDLVAGPEPSPQFPTRPAPAAPPTAPAPETPPTAPPGEWRTVVIDPGHGGDEAGAKGAAGTVEKDLTLTLARRLKASLESRLGLRVLLSRDGDQTMALDERTALANNNKADVLVSLHANAAARKDVSGAQIYYMAPDQSGADAAPSAASRQMLPTLGGGSRDIEMIPWELAQLRYLSESAALAGAIEEQCRGRVRLSPRAVQQAPLRVLAGANMPAVLVEVGFLTNPDEEQQLTSETYQSAIVQAIADGVIRYRDLAARSETTPPWPPASRPPAPEPDTAVYAARRRPGADGAWGRR